MKKTTKQMVCILILALPFMYESKSQEHLDIHGNPIVQNDTITPEYVKGEILVKFRMGELDSLLLER